MEIPDTTDSFSILLVEDDKTALDLLARMVSLRFPHCRIFTAEDGVKGLGLYKEQTPEIVVTDINMPEMDGIEMAKQIKKLTPDAVYIVLTAYGDKDYFEKFEEIGFCAYLMKPIDFKELFTTIEMCTKRLAEKG